MSTQPMSITPGLTVLPTLPQVQDRSTYVGGSDLADILNEEPFGCSRRLWMQKRAVEPDFEPVITGPMIRGTRLEDVFADEYELLTGRTVRRASGFRDKQHPELGAHIDRHIVAHDERGPGVLEIKTVNEWAMRKIRKEGLPTAYILQLQYYIRRKGWKWGSYFIGNADTWTFEYFDVELDAELCKQLDAEAIDFYAMVTDEDSEGPERLKVSDSRCRTCRYRTTCQGNELDKLVGAVPDNIETDEQLAPTLNDYFAVKSLADEATEELERVKEQLKELVGNRPAVSTAVGKILYSTVRTVRIDAASIHKLLEQMSTVYNTLTEFYAAHPTDSKPDLTPFQNLIKKAGGCNKESVSRPFRVFMS